MIRSLCGWPLANLSFSVRAMGQWGKNSWSIQGQWGKTSWRIQGQWGKNSWRIQVQRASVGFAANSQTKQGNVVQLSTLSLQVPMGQHSPSRTSTPLEKILWAESNQPVPNSSDKNSQDSIVVIGVYIWKLPAWILWSDFEHISATIPFNLNFDNSTNLCLRRVNLERRAGNFLACCSRCCDFSSSF